MTTSAYMPDVKVEIAFNAGYSTPTASRTWTDVSVYVELAADIKITRGRADEFGTAEANRLTLTLDNTDGRFTAGKTGGAYYPNVKIGRPIRVTSIVNAVTYTRFLGYVEEWPTEWDGSDQYAKAQISASSRMARLGFDAELRSVIAEEYLDNNPIAYYPLGEASGSSTAADLLGGPRLFNSGSGTAITFGAATGLTGSATGITSTSGSAKYLRASLDTVTSAAPGVVAECFMSATGMPTTTSCVGVALTGGPAELVLAVDGLGICYVNFFDVLNALQASSGATHADGQVFHAAATLIRDAGVTTLSLYIDGVLVSTDSSAGPALATFDAIRVGPVDVGKVSNVAISQSVAGIANRANAGLTGFTGETATERIARLGRYGGIAAAEIVGDAGTNTVDYIDTAGATALDAMRKVEETESGVLFDGKDNALTFKGRAARYSTASAFTLSAATQQIEAGVAPKLDRSTLVNDVNATATGGTARALNQASIDEYGYARSPIEIAASAEVAFQAASWRVALYAEPSQRIPALGVDMLPLSLALQASLLDADVGTRFTVSGLPAQAHASSADFFIEGYTESIGPESYEFTFNVSPVTGYDVWVLEDAVFGAYDTYPLAY